MNTFSKIISLEAIRGLAEIFITLASTKVTFLVDVTLVHSLLCQLLMGKVKIGHNCYLTADIFREFYRNVP